MKTEHKALAEVRLTIIKEIETEEKFLRHVQGGNRRLALEEASRARIAAFAQVLGWLADLETPAPYKRDGVTIIGEIVPFSPRKGVSDANS